MSHDQNMADEWYFTNCNLCVVFASMLSIICSFLVMVNRVKRIRKDVIVFTRYPVAGKAKTRLIPTLGPEGAARLQVFMTEHIIQVLQKVSSSFGTLSVTLQYNGGTHDDMSFWLDRKLFGLPCTYRPQVGASLGEKLKLAVKNSFKRGNTYVIVIGADIPGITHNVINAAFDTLKKPHTDMVLGKATDGGYYLVGFNCRAVGYIEKIFEDIDWGTEKVFLQQVNNAKAVNANISILTVELQDVDTEEDILVFEEHVGISRTDLCDTSWSIVVPVLNEQNNILCMLNNLLQNCANLKNIKEVLIVDGGSHDTTVDMVKDISKTSHVPIHIVISKPGRGNQLMTGAKKAAGRNLLFLHADTRLPQNFDSLAWECLNKPGVVAGAFPFQLDVLADSELQKKEPWWFIQQMKALVWGTNKRAVKYEKPYGDQAIFMTKEVYNMAGGFPPYFLMEDYIMVEKLQTLGHIAIVEGHPVITSYRRWRKWGYLKVTGLSQLIIMAYHLGVHPNTLAKWYYGDKIKID